MIRVKVGKPEMLGTVAIDIEQYKKMLKDGGNEYVRVDTPHGYYHFRIKYLREVEAA